jgi:hypothetical protein
VTTANYLKLVGGGRFNANLGGQDVLTSAPVSSFGFLGPQPGSLSFEQSQLTMPHNTGLRVVGGDINLNGASLTAPGGVLTIISLGLGSEEVPLNIVATGPTSFSASGHTNFSNGSIASIDSVTGGGALTIGASTLTLDNSTVSSVNSGSASGGNINLQITDALSLLNGGTIHSGAAGSGPGGNIAMQVGDLTVDGDNGTQSSSILCRAEAGTGPAGKLNVAADDITLSNGGFITGKTSTAGRGADITITAHTIDIFGGSAPGIFCNSAGTGDGGNIHLDVEDALTLSAGGEISAGAFSSGKGGDLTIHAGSLSVDGSATPGVFTGIAADTQGSGDAGNLTITVDQMLSVGSGRISADTFSSGHGSDLTIHAGSMLIDSSGIVSADAVKGTGNASDLTVTVDGLLAIKGGGGIKADTSTSGNGGEVKINAGSILIDGSASDFFTGIGADSEKGATGNAGDLTIVVVQTLSVV